MNKYIFLTVVALVNVSGVIEAGPSYAQQAVRATQEKVMDLPYQRANQARLLSLIFINDQELAKRYRKNAEFYARKSKIILELENVIDLVGYPVVDIVVGNGMNKIDELELIPNAMKRISPSNKKFILNNVQLITSAGITKVITIQATGKNVSFKQFGQSCAAQVGCDVADEFVIKPVVKMVVGDEDSLTAWGLRWVGNRIVAGYVTDKVSKL